MMCMEVEKGTGALGARPWAQAGCAVAACHMRPPPLRHSRSRPGLEPDPSGAGDRPPNHYRGFGPAAQLGGQRASNQGKD